MSTTTRSVGLGRHQRLPVAGRAVTARTYASCRCDHERWCPRHAPASYAIEAAKHRSDR